MRVKAWRRAWIEWVLATVVGTPTAGLDGSTFVSELPNTGLRFQSVDNKILNGTLSDPKDPSTFSGISKAAYVPTVAVDLAAPKYRKVADPVLQQGIEVLGKLDKQ